MDRGKRSVFVGDRRGATAVEYGIIMSLMFLAIVGAIKGFAASNSQVYNTIEQEIGSAH